MFRCISYYLDAFGTVCCVTTLSSKPAKLVQMFVRQSRVGIFRNDAHDPPHWTLNSCFGVFRTIWVHLVPFGYLTKLGAKWAEVVQNSCHEVASEFFAMNAPDPPHWTLNSRLGAFRTIRVHLGPFGCLTKLSAKRAEVVQKFVP